MSTRCCRVVSTMTAIHSVDDALLPPPETPDGGPEPLQSRPEVVLHGLTELLPCPGFCLSNRHSCAPLGLPVPACCLRSPTGQKGPIGLLLQFDGIPHRRCPPAVQELPPQQAPTTLRPQLRSAALTMEARNMAHSVSMSPASPDASLLLADGTQQTLGSALPGVQHLQRRLHVLLTQEEPSTFALHLNTQPTPEHSLHLNTQPPEHSLHLNTQPTPEHTAYT
ncbi:hypothetical protein N1851_015189 [Merluccius polli]|uniref:Uncharacterized protein n=1 Tax=Merluccius polli TaxID=89951 RepID=A0AA47P2E8_MERPO|nr:hypothetical protein N1851_015189 [Merluccius polli]